MNPPQTVGHGAPRSRFGGRGGLARLQPRPPAGPMRPVDGDEMAWAMSDFRRIPWSLSLVGFLVYVFVIVTFRIRIADVGMVAALVGLLFLPYAIRVPRLLIGMGVLYVWGWITMLASDYPEVVRSEMVVLGKLLLILLVAVNVLRTRSAIRFYMIFFLAIYAAYPARGTIFNYLGGYTHFGRALWNHTYSNSNDLAALTLLALSMAAAVLVGERNRWFRLAALVAIVVLAVIILLTKSRGVFLGLGLFAVLGMLANVRRLRNIGVVTLILAAIFALTPSDAIDRLVGLRHVADTENLQAVDQEGSAAQRFAIWKVGAEIAADHPVTGVGWGAYSTAHAVYSPLVDATGISRGKRDTHSTYLNVAAEAGYLGLGIFLVIVLGSLVHAESVRRRCRVAMPRAAHQLYMLELGLAGFLVASVFASYAQLNMLYLHLALLYGLARVCSDDLDRLRGAPTSMSRARAG
jgi:O-antigen ligase